MGQFLRVLSGLDRPPTIYMVYATGNHGGIIGSQEYHDFGDLSEGVRGKHDQGQKAKATLQGKLKVVKG